MAQERLFKPSTYRRIALAGETIPETPNTNTEKLFKLPTYIKIAFFGKTIPGILDNTDIEKYQTPRDVASRRINAALVKIFDDSDLHAAVRAYGQRITFAPSRTGPFRPGDDCYTGFFHLELDPDKRMVLVRRELQFMADHPDQVELNDYDLFQTDGGIFYVPYKASTEAVLAANDMRSVAKFDKRRALSANRVLKSLEAAIDGLIK